MRIGGEQTACLVARSATLSANPSKIGEPLFDVRDIARWNQHDGRKQQCASQSAVMEDEQRISQTGIDGRNRKAVRFASSLVNGELPSRLR